MEKSEWKFRDADPNWKLLGEIDQDRGNYEIERSVVFRNHNLSFRATAPYSTLLEEIEQIFNLSVAQVNSEDSVYRTKFLKPDQLNVLSSMAIRYTWIFKKDWDEVQSIFARDEVEAVVRYLSKMNYFLCWSKSL